MIRINKTLKLSGSGYLPVSSEIFESFLLDRTWQCLPSSQLVERCDGGNLLMQLGALEPMVTQNASTLLFVFSRQKSSPFGWRRRSGCTHGGRADGVQMHPGGTEHS